ncbi:nitroreductase family protein [Halothermothrix orenii]|uniref:Nitroreductase n=1 Tax=Halothermothrix orenii (strain H 168 / OCM 544 / DSM 9562) TaxID=373903 RepID=B8CYH5_HALOH|nr:nitroreductase family protein [Halothermothrix orenii]ACL70344.1 nitroreductase [Halothermothrix orenii H 168]
MNSIEVSTAIENRRAYRSLDKVDITDDLINQLGRAASLAPSCFNKQPWRYVFVYNKRQLKTLHTSLPDGNAWAKDGSLIIAVVSSKDMDCVVSGREYFLFDVGLSCANLILRATELNLVAHPIAGYDEDKVKKILNIPDEKTVITLIIIGKHRKGDNPNLTDNQKERELKRPVRLPLEKIVFHNHYHS